MYHYLRHTESLLNKGCKLLCYLSEACAHIWFVQEGKVYIPIKQPIQLELILVSLL